MHFFSLVWVRVRRFSLRTAEDIFEGGTPTYDPISDFFFFSVCFSTFQPLFFRANICEATFFLGARLSNSLACVFRLGICRVFELSVLPYVHGVSLIATKSEGEENKDESSGGK